MDATVEQLLADGRHVDAAQAARAAGDPVRAAKIYAQIWDFRRAAECALEAGDRVAAVGHLLDARATDEALALAHDIAAGDAARGAEVARMLAARRLHGPAGALHEQLGDRETAAQAYQRGGLLVDAARVLEAAGRLRDAGQLLERLAGGDAPSSDGDRAHAQLSLGRILARLGHHEEAVRHLQAAARHPDTRARALPLIGPELLALGFRAAAAEAAEVARAVAAPLGPAAQLPAAPAEPAPLVALIGGRYRPLRLLGAGAAGRVYLARDEVTSAEVAVKIFAATGQHGQASWERFLREAQVWRRADHPNIIKILDFRDDLGFLVMEFAEGGTLADHLGTRLGAPRVRRLALDVLAALAHAHERGVVHRDVKPANIFFDGRGHAKLGDFGVAHLTDLGQTQTGALIGTLAYMAPEQITGAPLDATADLYALGVTLFHALTGRLPFLGPDFIAQHLGEAPPRASEVAPDLSPAWDELLAALLAKDPAARPGSALEAAELVQGQGGARRILSLPRAVHDVERPAPAPAPVAKPRARYGDEMPVAETAIARLTRAVDRSLERTVVLERFSPGHPDEAGERRLKRLAAAATPYVQRVLGWDAATRVAVYEAPVGAPPTAPLAPPLVARIAAELDRALAALAEVGAVHGAITAERVLFDEESGVTLVASGLPAAEEGATAEGDRRAVAALLAEWEKATGNGQRATGNGQ